MNHLAIIISRQPNRLPLMFINSGGIVEYCIDYGLFEDYNFHEKLLYMVENYDKFFDKVQNYSLSSESTNKQFQIFINYS